MKTAVILVNWNGWQDTIECLTSLFAAQLPDTAIIVCDNGSTDGSLQHLRAWIEQTGQPHDFRAFSPSEPMTPPSRLTFLDTGANLGFSGGNNAGIELALSWGCEFIWLLNNDTTIEPDALTEMLSVFSDHPEIGVLGSLIRPMSDRGAIACAGGWYNPMTGQAADYTEIQSDRRPHEVPFVSGCSLLVRRTAIEKAGRMPEQYFLYCEDVDWCIRLKRAGYPSFVQPTSIVYHKESNSLGKLSRNKLYYTSRSSLLLVRSLFPHYLPLAIAFAMLRLLKRAIAGEFDQIRPMLAGFGDALQAKPHLRKPHF